ncbi:MAG TPA: nuclease-related domain-containing protein [Candidatus Limnocylindrales bacterium]|nr:nuclease-related domain-containing protein [Candidatus Limnocylindrales bacterium]
MDSEPWRVKYAGECLKCGRHLDVGEPAIYERRLRRIRCIECPTDGPAVHLETVGPVEQSVAGRSARERYEHLRDARDARVRGRLGNRLGGLALTLTSEPQSTRAWETGAVGEEEVGAMLDGLVGCRALHDRRVPGSPANIDHIVVAPSGIYVIDAKRYEGVVRVRDRGPLWRTDLRLYVGGRDRSKMADGLRWQVERVVKIIAGSGTTPLPRVVGVLCFVGSSWPLFRPPKEFEGLRLESPRSLEKALRGMNDHGTLDVDHWLPVMATAFPPRH